MKAFAFLACLLASLSATPAGATSVYEYKQDEYVIVEKGMVPDKRHSIAAHGNGELGDEDFHIYLMAADHRKIGPLEKIKETLDSGPNAFAAAWSSDSNFVAIRYRIDRHIYVTNIYRIAPGRAYTITGPSLRAFARVRFEGDWFLALPAGGIGPHGISQDIGRTRVFIPLHAFSDKTSGSFKVKFYSAGENTIS